MNKKKCLSVLLTLSMALSFLPAVTLSAVAGSAGITADYAWYTDGPGEDGFYHIGTPADLAGLSNLVSFSDSEGSGQSAALTFSGETIVLDSDIELNSGVTFTFAADTGLVTVANGEDAFYLGTGVKGNTDGGNTTFDGTASVTGTVYTDEAGTAGSAPFLLNPWVPIGSDSAVFSGTFDGGSHTVSGIYINASALNDQGLFGYGEDSTIQNVNLDNGFIYGMNQVGGIAGYLNRGTVRNCTNGCTVTGCGEITPYYSQINVNVCLGGIAGSVNDSGMVSDCLNTGMITSTAVFTDPLNLFYAYIGGVVGYIQDANGIAVSDCRNTGSIRSVGSNIKRMAYAGGVVGYISGSGASVSGCSNSGSITGISSNQIYVGGVVGYTLNGPSLLNCTNTGSLSAQCGIDSYAGGIAGYSKTGTFTECQNSGSITSTARGSYAAGIVAKAVTVSMTDCKNEGHVSAAATTEGDEMIPPHYSVSGTSLMEGGIAAYTDTNGTMSNCWNSGEISGVVASADSLGPGACIGGITGFNNAVMLLNCFNTANVECAAASTSTRYVSIGGVTGCNAGTAANCYNTGSITNTGTNIAQVFLGGVAGRNNRLLYNCYSTGSVSGTGTEAYIGGVAGLQSPGELSDCYWLSGAAQTVNGTARPEGCAVGGYYYNSSFFVAGSAGYTTNFSYSKITDCYSFDGSGTTWTLSCGAYDITPASAGSAVSVAENAPLVNALNLWVDTVDYNTWASDSDASPVNGGFPVLSAVYVPALSGTPTVAGAVRIGATLTATANAAPNTNLSYQWMVSEDGADWQNAAGTGSNAAAYTVDSADGGKYLRVRVTSGDALGAVYSATTQVPYTITLTASGNTETEVVSFSDSVSETTAYAASGEVLIYYTLDSSGTKANTLSFSGGTVTEVTAPGTGSLTYTVNADDALNGTIALTASFVHTNASRPAVTQPPKVPIIVNGQSLIAGTAETTTVNGKKETAVTVDADRLNAILDSEKSGATVIIPAAGGSDVLSGVLTGQIVKNMENKEATLVVQTDSARYTLPASQVNIDGIAEQFGAGVSLTDIEVTVSIAQPSANMASVLEDASAEGGFTVQAPAADFTVSCAYHGQTANVSSFSAYVEREIAIPAGADTDKITTAVVVHADKTTRHVPTKIIERDGTCFAVISSLTNSTYAVVYHPVVFRDAENHWAQDSINDLGSRMIVLGDENGNYNPDKWMTRAEFAAIMVRALGLDPSTGACRFSDVASMDWYCGYIETAFEYGIVEGYPGGTFGPNDTITREQAMTMIARAMTITKLDADVSADGVSWLLGAFSDGAAASAYAKDGIAACLTAGIISGTSSTTISPGSDVTRAEVAVMVQRLLQTSNLI